MTTVPQPADPPKAYMCTYDAWNRLVTVVDAPSGNTVAQYAYDGAKRRTVKLKYTADVLSETRHFFYTEPQKWQPIEERVNTSTIPERQFVWGVRYIDDLVFRDRDTTGSGTLDERLFGLQDPNWNVVAVVDSAGAVQERYRYDPYGIPTFVTADFGSRASSNYAWTLLFAGYRCDSLTGLYQVRHRYQSPHLGSFTTRDQNGQSRTAASLYEYVASNPLSKVDPSGLDGCSHTEWIRGFWEVPLMFAFNRLVVKMEYSLDLSYTWVLRASARAGLTKARTSRSCKELHQTAS